MFVFSLILFLATVGRCAIIRIPEDYPTVQQGLYAATEDDTVLVADGTYYENLKFPPLNLVLASEFLIDGDSSHISATILDGGQPTDPDSASVIFMDGGQDSSTCVMGFTLTGGRGTLNSLWWPGYDIRYGGGCALYACSPVIKHNCFISDSSNFGSGVYMGSGTDALIQDNQFFQNHCIGGNGTIKGDSCAGRVMGNEIHHNSAYAYAALAFLHCDTVLFLNNYIHHNTADHTIAGSFLDGAYIFIGNIITDHSALDPWTAGSVGFLFGQANVIIQDNQFLRNTNGFFCSGLELVSGCSGVICENLFQDNSSVMGSAIVLWNGTYTVSYNQFINNHDSLYGVIYVGNGAVTNIHHNTITGSTKVGYRASAIIGNINAPLEIHDNNIFGNDAPAVGVDTLCTYTIDAVNNWWGDPTGPFHPTLNPYGLGDTVGDNVLFNPWLTSYMGIQDNPIDIHPSAFRLHPAFPNPLNATTVLSYQLPVASHVNLQVYDTAGRLVAELVNGWRYAGDHQITFDPKGAGGSGLAAGIYFAKLEAGDFSQVQKLVILK